MLKVIRHKGFMKKVLWVLAVVIILSFGVFGQLYIIKNLGKETSAGKIFGHKVSMEEYNFNLQQTRIQVMLQTGRPVNSPAELLRLDPLTWDRMILLREADRRRIKISDADVITAIEGYPFFQQEGVFNPRLYDQIINYTFRIKKRDFEEGLRDSLKFAKLFEQETQNVTVPAEEVRTLFKMRTEQVRVTYALLSPEQYLKNIPFDEIEAKKYFLDHKEEFVEPPQINIEYIRVDFPPATASPPADKTAETSSPEEEQATAAEDAGQDQPSVDQPAREKAWETAQEVATAALDDKEDFQQLARKMDLPLGTTGFFSMEQPDLSQGWSFALIQQLFELQPREVIGPIETPTGYQVLRLKDEREATVPDYPQAQEKVKEAWTRSRAMATAKEKAVALLPRLKELLSRADNPLTFTAAAAELGLKTYQTPLFHRGQYLPNIGLSQDFQQNAFALNDQDPVSAPVETAKGYAILHLDDYVPIDEKAFEKEKDNYRKELLQQRQETVFEEFLTRLRLKANLENNIPEILKNQGRLR